MVPIRLFALLSILSIPAAIHGATEHSPQEIAHAMHFYRCILETPQTVAGARTLYEANINDQKLKSLIECDSFDQKSFALILSTVFALQNDATIKSCLKQALQDTRTSSVTEK